MPRLKLFLLGPPQLELDGLLCDLHSHKALALFAYLAVTRQPHSRAKLATLFWPEHEERRALAYLRHTLWAVRKTLGDEWLASEQEWIALQAGTDLWVDVTVFQELLAATDRPLDAAVHLYRDDFLAGFSLRDSPMFDEWHFFQSEQLRQQLASALQQLVKGHIAAGAFQAAIPYARRWLALDSLHEEAHQSLLQLYAWSGQRAAAVRQYRECRRILRDELNVNPSPETQALYQQLHGGELQPPSPPTIHAFALPTSAAVSAPVATPALSTEADPLEDELRFVTLLAVGLYADGSPHASMAEGLAPDLLAEQTVRLLTMVRAAAATYQAQVEPVMGGTVLVIFGATATHEDDAERALQVALTILARAHQQQLPVSIGACSGLAYVSSQRVELQQQRLPGLIVLGSVVTLATRIQARLVAGECGVCNPVYRQTQGIFRFEARSLQLLAGQAPLPVYTLQGRRHTPHKVRGIAGLHAQLVGRSAELAQLQRLAQQVAQGNGQLVAIIGEAGVGKSRLALEFHAQLPRHSPPWLWLEGRSLEMAQGSSYAPFIDLLRTFWGWRPEESDANRANSIRRLLTDLQEDRSLEEIEVSEIGAVLGRLLGLRFENEWDRQLDQVDIHQIHARTAQALCRLFVAISHHQPLLLVLEDLHWADTLSLDLIHLLLAVLPQNAIGLLCLYRPEQQRRSWQLATSAAQKCPGHFCQIDLHELTPAQSRLMIANLLYLPDHDGIESAAPVLPLAVQALILERAQGNPLYLEELIYSLIDRGLLARQVNGWQVATPINVSSVPESLQSIIFTRLDALGSPWKQILQRAAVIGRTFRRRLLAALMPPDTDLDDALQRLIDAMFLYQERLFPEPEFSFRHVLVQDAIYHGLTQRQRRQLHRQVAQNIELMAGARVHEQIDLLAHHWSQAGEPPEAIHYLLLAGDKAYAALAYREAADYYRHAVGFLREQEDHALTARTLMKLGNSYHSAGDYRRARQTFDDCFALNQLLAKLSSETALSDTAKAELSGSPAKTQTLRLAWGDPHSIDPIHTGATSAMAVVQQLFSPLVQIGPAFEIVPAVAARWEILQGGRRYIFHLRRDLQWSDGAPVTAHDYALTLRRILAPDHFANMAGLFFAIKNGQAYYKGAVTDLTRLGVTVTDDHTLVIDLEQPASYFLQSLTCAAAYPTPAHLFAHHSDAWTMPAVLAANGPFALVEWQRDHALTLQRNPHFLDESTGNVGQIELRFDLTTAQQIAAYESDQLDALWLNDLPPEERERLRLRHPHEYRTSPRLDVIFAAFNLTRPPFRDRRIRQAFVHAMDREALVNRALGGYEQPALGGMIPVGLPGHSPEIGLGFDPDRAYALLQEALQEAECTDVKQFETITALTWQGTEAVCAALNEQWQRHLGVEIAWRTLPYPEFLRTRYEEGPDLFLFGWSSDYPDATLFLDLFADANVCPWPDAEFHSLFEEAQRTADPTARLRLLAQADRIAMAAAVAMPLYYERLQFLLKPHVTHYPLSPTSWWFWQDVIMEQPSAAWPT